MPLGIFAGDASAVLGKVTKPVLPLPVFRRVDRFLLLRVVLSVVSWFRTYSASSSWSALSCSFIDVGFFVFAP